MNASNDIKEFVTPILPVEVENLDVNVYIKRDDLLPFSFGGNKVRIVREYFKDMIDLGRNCIIGYGSPQSNLCRVLADLSCSRKIPCHIITSLETDEEICLTNNNRLVNICGAVTHISEKKNVADMVQSVMDQCTDKGLKPYYIYGDRNGKGNEAVPVRAYVKVYEEIKSWQEQMGVQFDYIFLATGTGMSQAGLVAGKMQYGGSEKIVGISVSRAAQTEQEIIKKYIDVYRSKRNEEYLLPDIEVVDSYLCGGYNRYNKEIEDTIWNMYKVNGIPLDPIYTGKAFWGMKEYIRDMQIAGKNILFIHTGGTPLFFDFLINK